MRPHGARCDAACASQCDTVHIGEETQQESGTRRASWKVRSDTSSLRREASYIERRYGPDRRKQIFRALLIGSFRPRRRGPRRSGEAGFASTDWYHSRWLTASVLILLLCVADALLTLTLLAHGALEVNPLMAWLLTTDPLAFATIKFALTGAGVVFLTAAARVRAFGHLPVGAILYAVLIGYAVLVAYELFLLQTLVLDR
jgi:hypothetical protein